MMDKRTNNTNWGMCPACLFERKLVNGVMRPHRVFNRETATSGEMVACAGEGLPPMQPYRTIDTRNMFRGVK
jgi:hypothetical protein